MTIVNYYPVMELMTPVWVILLLCIFTCVFCFFHNKESYRRRLENSECSIWSCFSLWNSFISCRKYKTRAKPL